MWIHLNKSVKVHLKFPATKVADNRADIIVLKNGRGEVRVVAPRWRNAACTKKRNKKCHCVWMDGTHQKAKRGVKNREKAEEMDGCVRFNIMSHYAQEM